MSAIVTAISGGVRIAIKAVPGASRDGLAGPLGQRLKVRVAAAPEGGKANAAICELLAGVLGVPSRRVSVASGHTRAAKTIEVTGITETQARAALGL